MCNSIVLPLQKSNSLADKSWADWAQMLIWLFSMILTTGVIFNPSKNFPLSSTWLVSAFRGVVQLLTTLEPSLCFCLNTFNRILDFLQCINTLLRHLPWLQRSTPFYVQHLWQQQHQFCLAQPTSTIFTARNTSHKETDFILEIQFLKLSQYNTCLAGGSYLMLPSLPIAVPGSSSALDCFQSPSAPTFPAFPLTSAVSFPATPRKPQKPPLPYLPQLLPNYCFNCSIIRTAPGYLKACSTF